MIKDEDTFSKEIIGAAIEVHRNLGPGLLESAYEECLCRELAICNLTFERQKPLVISYKGVKLDCGYRLDIVVGGLVILELKAVERIEPIHEAQLLTYLKLSDLKLGILIKRGMHLTLVHTISWGSQNHSTSMYCGYKNQVHSPID